MIKFLASKISTHFEKRFEKFFELKNCNEVNFAVVSTITHPHFKLKPFTNVKKYNSSELHDKLVKTVAEACATITVKNNSSKGGENGRLVHKLVFVSYCFH